jgi:glycosyltransferase involved in cell wall biosynthesis
MNRYETAPLILASSYPSVEACAPRTDFTLLAQALGDAPVLFPPTQGNIVVRFLESITASDLRQAIAAFRRHRSVSVYVSLSEKIGLPLALLLAIKRLHTPHVLVAHHLTSPRKRTLQSRVRWLQRFSRIVVLSEPQAAYLRDDVGYPEEQTVLLPDSVDTDFWHTQGRSPAAEPFVLSVGQERRDYETLFAAAQELPSLSFVVVAGSVWADRSKIRGTAPPNVTIRQDLSYAALRTLYDNASLVVVPLQAGTLYAAGANGLLEGMAMGKAVILTETPGLRDYVRQGETSRIVPCTDPRALADEIRRLQGSRTDAQRLGREARRAIEARHCLLHYVAALARTVRETESRQ